MGVALRKESVDRNSLHTDTIRKTQRSLSARRAWIEIVTATAATAGGHNVALRKESVDRNSIAQALRLYKPRRSPQGERG